MEQENRLNGDKKEDEQQQQKCFWTIKLQIRINQLPDFAARWHHVSGICSATFI
jgi:hypothetical protein